VNSEIQAVAAKVLSPTPPLREKLAFVLLPLARLAASRLGPEKKKCFFQPAPLPPQPAAEESVLRTWAQAVKGPTRKRHGRRNRARMEGRTRQAGCSWWLVWPWTPGAGGVSPFRRAARSVLSCDGGKRRGIANWPVRLLWCPHPSDRIG